MRGEGGEGEGRVRVGEGGERESKREREGRGRRVEQWMEGVWCGRSHSEIHIVVVLNKEIVS